MLYFESNKFDVLFSRKYYIVNIVIVMILLAITWKTIPTFGPYISVGASILFLGVSWKSILGRTMTRLEYEKNYIILIYLIMFIIVVSLFTIEKEYIIVIPFLMSMVFGNVNVIFRSNFLQKINQIFMLTPLIKIVITYRNFEYFSVFVFIASLVVITNLLFTTNRNRLEAESEMKADFVKEVFKLTSQLSNHDVRNSLTKMMILSKKEYRENLPKFLEEYDNCVSDILSHINLDVFSNTDINITELIDKMTHVTRKDNVNFIFDCRDDIKVVANSNIVYSTIKNFIENSIEAANRKNEDVSIMLTKYKNIVEIADNCGGFDVNNIKTGNTTKNSKGHGIFLSTIIDPAVQKMFGFEVNLYNTGIGIKTVIKFNSVSSQSTKG